MVITVPWIFSFVLLFSLSASGLAQDVSSIAKPAEIKQQGVTKSPMPESLTSGWWSYFAVTGADFRLRIEEAANQYTRLLKQLNQEQRAIAGEHVEKIITHLHTVQKLSAADSIQTNTIGQEKFKEIYSIDEWLAFATHLQSEKADVENQSRRISRERDEIKSAHKRFSRMMLVYMELEGGNKKLLRGLELMAERSMIAVKEAQLKWGKQELEVQREQLSKLLEFNHGIAERLVADKAFILQIDQLLKQLRQEHIQIKKRLNLAQSETMGLMGKDPLQRTQARLNDQKVTNAYIDEAIVLIRIASLKAEKDLATLILTQDHKQLSDFFERNEKALQLSLELEPKIKDWLMDTTKEMGQVQASSMTLAAGNETAELRKLYQHRIQLTQLAFAALKQFELEQDKLTILMDEIDTRLARLSGKFGNIVNWSSKKIGGLKNNIISWWTEPLFEIGDTPVAAAGLLRVVLIIVVASVISSGFRRLLLRIAERKNMNGGNVAALYTVGRLAHYVILFIGIVIALSSIGLDFSNLALVAGALSVGIGFGLQSVVNNFVSGLILLFEGTLKVGDFIEIESGVAGIVREINVRSTLINTNDNVDIIVPNSVLVGNKVTNWTLREANRRIHVPFGVAYGTDKELVKKAVLEAASRVKYTHSFRRGEAAQCWLINFGDNSLNFELVVWINNEAVVRPGTVHAAYMWEIETSLKQYDIQIPFPQRDLHLRSVFGRTGSAKT